MKGAAMREMRATRVTRAMNLTRKRGKPEEATVCRSDRLFLFCIVLPRLLATHNHAYTSHTKFPSCRSSARETATRGATVGAVVRLCNFFVTNKTQSLFLQPSDKQVFQTIMFAAVRARVVKSNALCPVSGPPPVKMKNHTVLPLFSAFFALTLAPRPPHMHTTAPSNRFFPRVRQQTFSVESDSAPHQLVHRAAACWIVSAPEPPSSRVLRGHLFGWYERHGGRF